MELSGIFLNPVSRPIEGVIKADDESSLYLELSEYVLTNEVAKRLDALPGRLHRVPGRQRRVDLRLLRVAASRTC
jgi:hypothetical protein